VVQLAGGTLEIHIESCGDSSKNIEMIFSSFSQWYYCVLSSTGEMMKVTVLGEAQFLAMSVAEGP
jgi:hypothetical protein